MVGLDAAAVRLGGVLVAADALHDVRRHVLEVAGRRHHPGQALRRDGGLAGIRRGFHDVNVVVVGAGVAGVTAQHAFEPGDDLGGAGHRLARGRPQLPGVDVHLALGAQGLHVEIVGIARGDLAHGRGIGREHRAEVGGVERLGARVARRQRLDQRLLDGRGVRGVLLRLVQGVEGDAGARLDHRRHVVVRSDGERHAPVTGGAGRVELGCLGE